MRQPPHTKLENLAQEKIVWRGFACPQRHFRADDGVTSVADELAAGRIECAVLSSLPGDLLRSG